MNFLAHLILTRPTPDGWAGSLLPDLLRGRERRQASQGPGALAVAACHHRRIDALTDGHRAHQACRAMFRPAVGRYAAVVTDVVFDHLLSRSWERSVAQTLSLPEHGDDSLLPCERETFIDRVYQGLADDQGRWPANLAESFHRMIEQDWLNAYATPSGLASILEQMSQRFSLRFDQPVDLGAAMQPLQDHREQMLMHFDDFWTDLTDALQVAPEVQIV